MDFIIITSTAILHCISTYPTKYEDCNLRVLPLMAETFGTVVGFSDHTNGTAAAVAAVALGASPVMMSVPRPAWAAAGVGVSATRAPTNRTASRCVRSMAGTGWWM